MATYSVPLMRCMLPGPPRDYPQLATGEAISVAPAFCRPSVYAVVVCPDETMGVAANLGLQPGDRILIESDKGFWEANRHYLVGRLAVVVSSCGPLFLRKLVGEDDGKPKCDAPVDSTPILSSPRRDRSKPNRRLDIEWEPDRESDTSPGKIDEVRRESAPVPSEIKEPERVSGTPSGEFEAPDDPRAIDPSRVVGIALLMMRAL